MKKICSLFLTLTLLCGLWLSAGAEKATLEAGSCTVGSDLPAGDYEITCVKVSNFYTDYMESMQSLAGDDPELNALFSLYGSLGDTMEANVKIKGPYGENKGSFSLKEKDKKKLSLQKDWVITIEDGVLEFELVKAAAEEPASNEESTKQSKTVQTTLDLDLSKYSNDEILLIQELINQEIVTRRINKTAKVPSGSYVVGVDIPAGKYILERLMDTYCTNVHIYTDSTKNLQLSYAGVERGQSYVFSVEEGNLFEIDEDVVLTVYTGVSFN